MLQALSEQPLEALLFDLDGTLVDSVPDLHKAVDAALTQCGFPAAGQQRVRHWVGNGAQVLMTRALANAQGVAEADVDECLIADAYAHFLTHYHAFNGTSSALYAGVQDALAHWYNQGINMAVVTNKPTRFIEPLLSQFNLVDYFPVIVGGDTLPEKKPAAAPLLSACAQLGVSPGASIMIGDSRTDVFAARAVPMPVVCVSYGYNHAEPIQSSCPDAVVDSLAELVPGIG